LFLFSAVWCFAVLGRADVWFAMTRGWLGSGA
jgi:hypothetical protein